MPSSSRLHYLISDGYNSGDKQYCIDAYNQWLTSNCLHPQLIDVYDAHTASLRKIEVPCGKCYHCRETKINSWVTRMYAHLEDFKNAYFITLTYRSFTRNLHPAERLMLSKLGDAAYVLDSKNETKRLCYSPSLLVKSHYQNFMKRLRKYTGFDDISFVLSGEYGKVHGRPHFHAVLFTNHDLTAKDIKRAWSIALFRDHGLNWSYKRNNSAKNGTTYYVPIGRIDFNDLVRNGSLNTSAKVKVDGNFLNAGNCFAYVCKYVCKHDSYNNSRVIAAYHQMYDVRNYIDINNNSFDKNEVIAYLRKAGIKYNIYSLTNLLKSHSYVDIIPYQGKCLYPFNFQRSKVFHLPIDLFGTKSIALELIPRDINDYVSKFAPFVEFSRGTPIGSLYAYRHIQEFTDGVYKTPTLQYSSYVLPRYFLDKARDYVYGFRRLRKSLKGTSLCLGCLPNLHRFLHSALEDVTARYLYSCNFKTYQDLCSLLSSEKCLKDKYSGIKYLFPIEQNNVTVHGYIYDRHIRQYRLVHTTDFVSFAIDLLNRLNQEYETYTKFTNDSKKRLHDVDAVKCMLTDLGIDAHRLQDRFEEILRKQVDERQTLYDSLHASAE